MAGAEIALKLGHYRLAQQVGEGGMGIVYRAFDEHLEREVAVKVLPSGLLADEVARRRFRKEALALSRLNHPNIATVHDFDSDAGVDFLVMEFISGETVGERIARRTLPEADVVRLGTEMTEALAAAHDQGVIHCDLKPANLRVTTDGRLKILDFGVARLVRATEARGGTTVTVTQPSAAGTLPYMAPEQLRNEAVDARVDIWAAGVVLYEMATGQRPFGDDGVKLIDAILHASPVPPRVVTSALSPALEGVILKCLDKDPARRYQSARELLVDLQRLGVPTATVVLQRASSHRWLRWALPAIAVLTTLAALLTLDVGGVRGTLIGKGAQRIESIAVLPLANLSGDRSQDYFADGITDELITELSKITSLKVISRTSVMRFKNSTTPLPEIASALDVDALIEGSVMRAGNRVRINAQLIQGSSEKHLWADSFDRDITDVLALSSEVTHAIATEIHVKLTSREEARLQRKRSILPEAYEAYLQGRFFMNRSQWSKAAGYFETAVEKDPNFLPAWYAFRESSAMVDFSAGAWREELAAGGAIDRVMALEPDSAEAYIIRGDSSFYRQWDWSACDREFRRAVEVDPGSVDARYHYGLCLEALGKFDAALAEMQRAHELDPLAPLINSRLARLFEHVGQPDRALELYRTNTGLEPDDPFSYFALGRIEEQAGQTESAATHDLEGIKRAGLDAVDAAMLENVLKTHGAAAFRRKYAEVRLAELKRRSEREDIPPDSFAAAYAAVGQRDEAFKWLDMAFERRVPRLAWVKTSPDFDPLHSDVRFQDLLRRMKYPV